MIRAHNITVDWRCVHLTGNSVGYKKIIDSPSGVIGSGMIHVAPPSVCTNSIGIQQTESVGETALEQICEALPFLVREACITAIGSRIF